jgi:hypothetical protein
METAQAEGFAKFVPSPRAHPSWLTECCRSIGVSNYGPANLEKILKIAKVKPAVNQVGYIRSVAMGNGNSKTID